MLTSVRLLEIDSDIVNNFGAVPSWAFVCR